LSHEGHIRQGIPQGTSLGPMLFSLFVDDMKELVTNAKILKFADDTLLIFELDQDTESNAKRISADLELISNYYEENQLILNLNKSFALIIGDCCIDGISTVLQKYGISLVKSLKYLGIEIDDNMKFQSRFKEVTSKLNHAIGAVACLRNKLTIEPLMKFFYAHFISHLTYSIFIFTHLPSKDLHQLQVKQNRILKMIYKLPARFTTYRLYTEYATKTLPIMGLIFYSICKMVKKSLLEIDDALLQVTYLRSIRTRQLKVKESKTRVRNFDLEIIGASIFNSLPDKIRNISSLPTFKVELKQFLLSRTQSLISDQQFSARNRIL
jgi:hypothetical protein